MGNILKFTLLYVLLAAVAIGCAPVAPAREANSPTLAGLPDPTITPGVNEEVTAAPISSPTPPLSNSVYRGVVEGRNVLFTTSNLMQELYRESFSSHEYLGKIHCSGFDFHFSGLESPELLFTIVGNADWINVVCADGMAYISGIRMDDSRGDISFVYSVDPETGAYREVWTGMPGIVEQVWNNMIVISLLPCYRCSPTGPLRTIVVNAQTGAIKDLGEAGDVNILNDTVAYRRLAPLDVPCDPGEGCDGFYTDYRPAGEYLVETLP